mmetsp:Transcript_2330/g.6688  ORF Transcript_2330/g.6688 Transcript_2330/m.6688 type:complete len:217 (+) Transcript_2330:475-1125(+)
MPSRRPSRSSMMTCNCVWASSCFASASFSCSMMEFSEERSWSSASAIDRNWSSNVTTCMSHFCFSACNSSNSSSCTIGDPSKPSAILNFNRLSSISFFSQSVSVSTCFCCKAFTSSDSLVLVSLISRLLFEISSNSLCNLATCGLPSHCCARCNKLLRNPSSCCCNCCFLLFVFTSAFLKSSSWAFRSANVALLSSISFFNCSIWPSIRSRCATSS